jgi:hypothetical protein
MGIVRLRRCLEPSITYGVEVLLHSAGQRQRVKLYWMKTSEAWPDDSWLETKLDLL